MTFAPALPEQRPDTGEYYTPEEWIDRARRVMGEIDVDPFSCDIAQQTVRAGVYHTLADSALDHQWRGRIWYQPPYGAPLVTNAALKLLLEIDEGRATEVIGLTNTCTASGWWQQLALRAAVICFPRKRINFFRPLPGDTVVKQNGNRADQTFWYFGMRPHVFEDVFRDVGVCGRMRGQ